MNDKPDVSQTTPTTSAIAKIIARHPPHVQAGLLAYRAALGKRQDWHRAVAAAIEAADMARADKSKWEFGTCACGSYSHLRDSRCFSCEMGSVP